jgi:hypothetical protein
MFSHFPSFLVYFTFLTSFLNPTWSSRMRSSLINILDPFNLGVLLSIPYLWPLELILTHINLSLCSIIFPNLFASMWQVVSTCDLFFSSSLTIARVSPYLCSFAPKIMRFKALLLCSWSNYMSLFIHSLMGLLFNLGSK